MPGFAIPEPALVVVRTLRKHGYEVVFAGGCVRDLLLSRVPRDWDVATSASGAVVASLFRQINPVGLKHDTVGVFEQGLWVEVTRFRDPERTLRGDLGLRDFTINAIAFDPEMDRLIDPLAGQADLVAKRIRACGSAAARFQEDPLRMLRAARFIAELGFVPEEDVTMAARILFGRLRETAPERVRDETIKLLLGRFVREAMDWMAATGVLAVLYPDVAATQGVGQNRWHRWDVFRHTVETVARAESDLEVRLAGFFHDLGKPVTKRFIGGDWTFYNHERVSARIATSVLDQYHFAQRLRDRVVALVSHHMFHYQPKWSDAAVRRFIQRVGPELVDPLFKLYLADSDAAGTDKKEQAAHNVAELRRRIEAQLSARYALKVSDLDIDGYDVMRLTGGPGPLVGRVLRDLLDRVIEEPSLNQRDRLLREAENILQAGA